MIHMHKKKDANVFHYIYGGAININVFLANFC